MILTVSLPKNAYDVVIERGALARCGEILALHRRVLIVTDAGVPAAYAERVAAACRDPLLMTLPTGEATKSLASLEEMGKLITTVGEVICRIAGDMRRGEASPRPRDGDKKNRACEFCDMRAVCRHSDM